MQLVFSDQEFPTAITKSMFLAGPSPRSNNFADWRPKALQILNELNFDGFVFIPIPKDKFYGNDDQIGWTYIGQTSWERKGRQIADIILFWVDREIDISDKDLGMPGFTTNVEFGKDLNSGKILYGRPDDSPKCRYLDDEYSTQLKQKVFTNLTDLLQEAVLKLGAGSYRTGGEIYVPLFIWNTEQFQSWYSQLKAVGNKLEEAKLLYHFTIGNGIVFSYILWVNIWIEAEQRFKSNEFVFARKDISTIVAYYKDKEQSYPNDIQSNGHHKNACSNDIQLVVIKEFRSPVNNSAGFVYELPGGSSVKPNMDPQVNAQHELQEEAGLFIEDLSRFKYVGSRQLVATLSSHKAQVYSIELNKNEFEKIQEYVSNQTTFGVEEDTEKTYVDIIPVGKLKESFLDFSMLGMVYEALYF